MFENGHQPQAVILVSGVFELDMGGKPGTEVERCPSIHGQA